VSGDKARECSDIISVFRGKRSALTILINNLRIIVQNPIAKIFFSESVQQQLMRVIPKKILSCGIPHSTTLAIKLDLPFRNDETA
jgi:hypothetical protein